MKHIIFEPNTIYKTAILIKSTALNKNELLKHYIDPIGLMHDEVFAVSLRHENNKCTIAQAKVYLEELLPILNDLGVVNLFVCDGIYFKALTKIGKLAPHYGYAAESKLTGYEGFKSFLGSNYQSLMFNPSVQVKIDLSLAALSATVLRTGVKLGSNVIHSEYYPKSVSEIKDTLAKLLSYEMVSIDVETNSLDFWEAGLETIAFAWDEHNGISFCVDRDNSEFKASAIRGFIKQFFIDYKGICLYQNANYDTKVLVYELWMYDLLDHKGKLDGIEVMCKNLEDTKIITYLATNSTAGNTLGLKENSHEYMGNYNIF